MTNTNNIIEKVCDKGHTYIVGEISLGCKYCFYDYLDKGGTLD